LQSDLREVRGVSWYPSGERPLDACPEVIGLIRFSDLVIRPVE